MDPSQILSYPHVNGAECSFCSIEFKVGGGIKLPGCKSINYNVLVGVHLDALRDAPYRGAQKS